MRNTELRLFTVYLHYQLVVILLDSEIRVILKDNMSIIQNLYCYYTNVRIEIL
jgi:hypothetical protein